MEERIAQLEAEVADIREQLAQAPARIHELEGRLVKDSHTSLKSLSSDEMGRQTVNQRSVPVEVKALGKSGPRVQALAVFLHHSQLLPMGGPGR